MIRGLYFQIFDYTGFPVSLRLNCTCVLSPFLYIKHKGQNKAKIMTLVFFFPEPINIITNNKEYCFNKHEFEKLFPGVILENWFIMYDLEKVTWFQLLLSFTLIRYAWERKNLYVNLLKTRGDIYKKIFVSHVNYLKANKRPSGPEHLFMFDEHESVLSHTKRREFFKAIGHGKSMKECILDDFFDFPRLKSFTNNFFQECKE